jgi:hypothetical protein
MYLNLTENLNLKIIQSHQNCDINSLEVDLNDRYLFSSGEYQIFLNIVMELSEHGLKTPLT